MKKIFKTAASLAVGCALLSTSAFAALEGSTVTKDETGAVVALKGYAAKAQSTILVVKGETELEAIPADLADAAIAYINQAEATDGTINYDVNVTGDGTYTVFAGGSDQSAASKIGAFTITSVVDVTGVTLAIEGLTADENGNFATELTVGDTLTVNATVAPDNATDKTVTWTSSNADVATVEGGVVTTKAAGDVVITATAGSFSKTVTIKVNEKAPALPEGTTIAIRTSSNGTQHINPYVFGTEDAKVAIVQVKGIANGSVKICGVDAYLADYTGINPLTQNAWGGIRQYLAIVPYVDGQVYTTSDITWDATVTDEQLKANGLMLTFGDPTGDNLIKSADGTVTKRKAVNVSVPQFDNAEKYDVVRAYLAADVTKDGALKSGDGTVIGRRAVNVNANIAAIK